MRANRYIRIIIALFMLHMCGAVEVWAALTVGNITIQVEPAKAGTVTATNVSGREVTLTVTPASDYYIRVFDIVVEPLVGMDRANARRRVPGFADQIEGKMYQDDTEKGSVVYPNTATYKFTLPERYDGAYVTATFKTSTAIIVSSSSPIGSNPDMSASAHYILVDDVDESDIAALFTASQTTAFSGTFEGEAKADGTFPKITGLTHALFNTINDGTVKNVILEDVNIPSGTNVGAIANEATGAARIYNCGILPTEVTSDAKGNITGFTGSSVSGSGYVGGIVGLLGGNARVINCYSYATVAGGSMAAGLVGNIGYANDGTITQDDVTSKPMVMNCMFYGDIISGAKKAPVYNGLGKAMIKNEAVKGVNPYCYFRGNASFNNTTNFPKVDDYKRSWPADEEYLTRFEYYRSILNSNKRLCVYWTTGKEYGSVDAPTAADEAMIAKWVLDPEIAPYPILKKWDKYPSIINPNPENTIDPRLKDDNGLPLTPTWTSRPSVSESGDNGLDAYKGGVFKNLRVSVDAGSGHAGSSPSSKTILLPITDMDTLNYDFGYYKVQLPYYNELFGNPDADPATDWDNRYGGNYKANVVTGWMIISMSGGTDVTDKSGTDDNGVAYDHRFTANWESGYNFADRYCTTKDIYNASTNPRVFAQGGFFYVPEGVTSISIEAYWGKAVYLHNAGHYIDRVNITNSSDVSNGTAGSPFTPAGTLPTTFQGQDVYDTWIDAVKHLDEATESGSGASLKLNKTVFDQAIVLLSNFQWKNQNATVGYDIESKWHPYTFMSIDQDLDNEPDYCFEFQYRNQWERNGIQPIRFDFLSVPELGLAVRHDKPQNTIGIFVPQGHFEITETSFMHLTQFEYDAAKTGSSGVCGTKIPAPVILNGGHFEQIVVRYGPQNNTQYFLMGGHFCMKRFAPGAHTNINQKAKLRLCAVNAIGGEYPEFYLSGIYRPDLEPESIAKQGNPHCYTNGGRFGSMNGAGYDKILGSVTFKIDHSIIGEFYGGGINGANPVGGSINVTIDHSLVTKYCGGPKVGTMTAGETVTTHATGTTFGRFYGGGNGGTSYYRETGYDGNDYNLPKTESGWIGSGNNLAGKAKYTEFNPLNNTTTLSYQYDITKGYNALFEFECFVESNGLGGKPTLRTYTHWAQFGTTSTGSITNVLNNCTVKETFYGGGNLGNVRGDVTSTLTDCIIQQDAYAGGYSGKIEPFRIHDRSQHVIPYEDNAGIIHNVDLPYEKDGLNDRYYTWCYRKSATEFLPKGVTIPADASTTTVGKSTFRNNSDGKWYVLTDVSLEGLGAVSGNAELTLKGTTSVAGSVYGGGAESNVNGNTAVTLQDAAHVGGDVFGGGNMGEVSGSTTVEIKE